MKPSLKLSVAVPGRVCVEECLLGSARPFVFLVWEGLFFSLVEARFS